MAADDLHEVATYLSSLLVVSDNTTMSGKVWQDQSSLHTKCKCAMTTTNLPQSRQNDVAIRIGPKYKPLAGVRSGIEDQLKSWVRGLGLEYCPLPPLTKLSTLRGASRYVDLNCPPSIFALGSLKFTHCGKRPSNRIRVFDCRSHVIQVALYSIYHTASD